MIYIPEGPAYCLPALIYQFEGQNVLAVGLDLEACEQLQESSVQRGHRERFEAAVASFAVSAGCEILERNVQQVG